MTHRISLGALALSIALVPAVARADDGAGAFRIGAGTNLFGWQSSDTHTSAAGTHSEGFDVGVLSPSLTLDVGVQVAPWIAVGVLGTARYSQRAQSTSIGAATTTTTTITYDVLAYVEGSFRVDVARPFLRLCGGALGTDQHGASVTLAGMTFNPGSSSVQGVFAVMLGAHLFAADVLSISPFVSFAYAAGNGSTGTMSGSMPTSLEGITLQLGMEVLGWIGGD